jgi:hypothetical protein
LPGLPRTATSNWEEFDLDLSGLQPKPATLFFRCRVVD